MNNEDGIVRKLHGKKLLKFEQEFIKNTCYEVISGSISYGVQSKNSDMDIVGIVIPPKDWVFPPGIPNFGPQPLKFDVYQEHHIIDPDTQKEYDLCVYGIVKYFQLAAENNPNLIDSLFVKDNHVLHQNFAGKILRQNRKLFLTKRASHTFMGYSVQQYKKMKHYKGEGSRKESFELHGYDLKQGTHLARLILEVEQILVEHDLDLMRHSQILTSIRNGEWTLERIENWFKEKELTISNLYTTSTLRHSPDWQALTALLYSILEEEYGNIDRLERSQADSNLQLLREFKHKLKHIE